MLFKKHFICKSDKHVEQTKKNCPIAQVTKNRKRGEEVTPCQKVGQMFYDWLKNKASNSSEFLNHETHAGLFLNIHGYSCSNKVIEDLEPWMGKTFSLGTKENVIVQNTPPAKC